jgi:hypothetical protein
MAKATITFNLPDEQQEFMDAVHASDYKAVIWDLDQKLRSKIRHDESIDNQTELAYQSVRDMLNGLLEEYKVSLE